MAIPTINLYLNDVVIYTNNIYGDSARNPLFDGNQGQIEGKVTGFDMDRDLIYVRWSNGRSMDYTSSALTKLEYISPKNFIRYSLIKFKVNLVNETKRTGIDKKITLGLDKKRYKGLFNL